MIQCYNEVSYMDEPKLTTEDLDRISELQEQLDNQKQYTPRPKSHRVFAWLLVGLMVLGIGLYCYWQITPL